MAQIQNLNPKPQFQNSKFQIPVFHKYINMNYDLYNREVCLSQSASMNTHSHNNNVKSGMITIWYFFLSWEFLLGLQIKINLFDSDLNLCKPKSQNCKKIFME